VRRLTAGKRLIRGAPGRTGITPQFGRLSRARRQPRFL